MEITNLLSIAVTAVGAFLCLFFMIFMLRGDRVPGDKGEPQIIKYKGLELRTNSIITILLISAVVTVLPICLLFYFNSKAHYLSIKEKPESLDLFIAGRVQDETGRPLEGATAKITEMSLDGKINEIYSKTIEEDGEFSYPAHVQPDKKIKIETARPGYRKQAVIIELKGVNFPSVLVKK